MPAAHTALNTGAHQGSSLAKPKVQVRKTPTRAALDKKGKQRMTSGFSRRGFSCCQASTGAWCRARLPISSRCARNASNPSGSVWADCFSRLMAAGRERILRVAMLFGDFTKGGFSQAFRWATDEGRRIAKPRLREFFAQGASLQRRHDARQLAGLESARQFRQFLVAHGIKLNQKIHAFAGLLADGPIEGGAREKATRLRIRHRGENLGQRAIVVPHRMHQSRFPQVSALVRI